MPESTPFKRKLTVWEHLRVLVTLITIPGFSLTSTFLYPLSRMNQKRSWRRVLVDASVRHITYWTPIPLILAYVPGQATFYKKWLKANKTAALIDQNVAGAQIHWLGPKKTEYVILYFHGGGYQLPMGEEMFIFQDWLRQEIRRAGGPTPSTAMLDYSLAPDYPFPVQLRQAVAALNLLLESGVKPSNIFLMGDSAGGNLVLQLCSLILHPDPSSLPDPPKLSEPLGGAYICSPWVNLRGESPTFQADEDNLSLSTFKQWGATVLNCTPTDKREFMEASLAPPSWFDGVDKIVSRILVSYGEKEGLAYDCAEIGKTLAGKHPDVKILPEANGIHNEPMNDFRPGQDPKRAGSIAPAVVQWFKDGMTT